MQEKPTLIYIPPNVGGGAKGINVGGITTVRNLIEAVIVFFLSIFLMLFVKLIINISFISWIIVFAGIVLAFFCVIGVNGEPVSVFFMNVASYNNRRIFVTLRPPMPKEKEKQAFGSGLEQKIQNLVTKSEKNDDLDAAAPKKKKEKKVRPTKEERRAEKEAKKALRAEEKRAAKIAKIEARAAKQMEKVKRKNIKEGD